jgi:hypothetical protein
MPHAQVISASFAVHPSMIDLMAEESGVIDRLYEQARDDYDPYVDTEHGQEGDFYEVRIASYQTASTMLEHVFHEWLKQYEVDLPDDITFDACDMITNPRFRYTERGEEYIVFSYQHAPSEAPEEYEIVEYTSEALDAERRANKQAGQLVEKYAKQIMDLRDERDLLRKQLAELLFASEVPA